MVNELNYLPETSSQTAGPYVHIGLAPQQAGFEIFERNFTNVLAGPKTRGERIRIEGRVFDGSGTPVRDVLLEIWQANASASTRTPPIGRRRRSTGLSGVGAAPVRISRRASTGSTPSSRDR